MTSPLWTPSADQISKANMTRFIGFVNQRFGKAFTDYDQLHQWSVEEIADFWAAMWEFAEIKHSQGYDKVVDDLTRMPGAEWFIGARLNFAENLLQFKDDRTALVFRGEGQAPVKITYARLNDQVARLAKSLREGPGWSRAIASAASCPT